ncbi:multiple sugar transport system permease protein [Amycolatopsis arida]|uniref:Multiple sugar transport system permease protein n=1 Tax=Amycolatopsis arida TaxID=587909 RepID=A0A1I5ZUA4_9PSEU|nr:sugar ABC transporter permease [Amycolatopsis arida]TDX89359.1 multiple sugar transport system permease protein [Amycolatopsis arida]SFQ59807.1 multiple sugar transport system permease protein [Amycolatopsis arida]
MTSAPTEPATRAVHTGPSGAAATDAAGLGRTRASLFVLPAFVLIGAFLVFPALWTLYLGLTNYRLTGIAAADPEFVGLDNYTGALSDSGFTHSLWLTLLYVLGSAVVGQCVLGFTLAWTLRRVRRTLRTVVESLVVLAWILPGSAVAFLWIALLDRDAGTLNALLGTPGMAWLIEHPMLSIIIFNTWRGTAFSMLLFGAALNAVPPSQLETARMSGASGWQQLRDVVFPHIRGHVLTNLLLISLWTFNDFTPYLITAGGPNHASEILPLFVYRTAISDGQLGFGSAISLIMLVINLVLAVLYLRLLRERRA